MKRVKQRIFSGVVCEQEIYTVADRVREDGTYIQRLRFRTPEERAAHRSGISRRRHARLVNENFSPSSVYSTLTFDDDNEVHTFDDAKRLRNNYVRRLQRACPDARIMIYIGRGKNTRRIHMHMLSDGVPEDVIEGKWTYGKIVSMERLREHVYYNGIDHGKDYTGLANYLFDHWTPEQGGHRWKATRNLRQPQKEAPKEAKRSYSAEHPPKPPKGYELVDCKITGYGYQWFKYIRIPEKRGRQRGRPNIGL